MNEETEAIIKTRLQQLDGQIGALTMALQGLILAQSDPHACARAAQERIEKYLSSGLASTAPDAYLHGVQQGQKELFPKPQAL